MQPDVTPDADRIIVFKDGQMADHRPVMHRTIARWALYEPVTAGESAEVG